MNIRPAIALTVVLMVSTALSWGQARGRVGGSALAQRRATPTLSASASAAAPTRHTSSLVPPGWGLAPGPASTVNHPGGIPQPGMNSLQPLTGIQPLIPTG